MNYYSGELLGGVKNFENSFISKYEEETFNLHLRQQPKDWIYRNVDVTYKFNSLGHRCKEIDELDDFFLVIGCSNTLGYGLPLERTYPYLLSQKLNLDYYNLSMNGAGPDIVFINLLIFLNNYKKPKFVLIQWPDISRMFFILQQEDEYKVMHLHNTNTTNYSSYGTYKDLLRHNVPVYHNMLYRNVLNDFLKKNNISTYEFFLHGWINPDDDEPLHDHFNNDFSTILPLHGIEVVDRARDLAHPGLVTNYMYYKTIIDNMDHKKKFDYL